MTFLGVPLARMCNEAFADPRERILMKNIAYAGSLCAALDIDMPIVEALLEEKFGRKKALLESNHQALKLGYDYAKRATSSARCRSISKRWTPTATRS